MKTYMMKRDVDLLLLIREEETYAQRIRDALVFSEKDMKRNPALLAERNQEEIDAKKALYIRPKSAAERADIEEEEIIEQQTASRRSSQRRCEQSDEELGSSLASSIPYKNPPVDQRRTVVDADALYSTGRGMQSLPFTYADLVASLEGRKQIKARALRVLANLWDKNPKLRKEDMLAVLIGEYARRYPDEVEAYEQQQARQTRSKKARPRRPRRR